MRAIPARRLLLVAAAGAAIALGVAQAQTASSAGTQASAAAPTVSATAQLSIRDIYDRMQAAGYREMREIKLDKGRYEVKARDAHGDRVKLLVNAATGQGGAGAQGSLSAPANTPGEEP